jgi:uncharacterized protein (DUF433 family)
MDWFRLGGKWMGNDEAGSFPGRRGPAFHGGMMGFDFDQMDEYHQEALAAFAKELGLSVDEIEAALAEGKTFPEIMEEYNLDMADVQAAAQATRQKMMEKAVEDGLLTQEQADLMDQRGFGRGFGMRGGFGPMGGGFGRMGGSFGSMGGDFGPWQEYRQQMFALTLEKLGLDVEEVEAALAEGKTPYELMEEYNLEMTDVQAAAQEASQEVLEQAVKDGALTQEQADMIGQHGANRGFGHKGGFGMRGFRGGRGGPCGSFFGQPDDTQ